MKILKYAQPCPHCTSSDAYHVYKDGHGYCFSCQSYDRTVAEVTTQGFLSSLGDTPLDSETYTYEYLPLRGLTAETLRFFEIRTKINSEGKPVAIAFPYSPEAMKIRELESKKFYSKGEMSNASLFGKDRFNQASAKAITITEGELDAASAFQMLGSKYPVVSVRSGSSARVDCTRERDYLNSFDKIYLCFDNDKVGQEATREVASLFDFNKVYHVQMGHYKDANDFLVADKVADFRNAWYNARRFLPEGIISSQSDFNAIIDSASLKQGADYPFPILNKMTYGLRPGETVLFTAMEGVGKTEILRAIEYSLLQTTDSNVGIIHLEESKSRSLQGLAGYYLGHPVHLPDSNTSPDEIKQALEALVKRDERLHLYSHFGSSDPDIILDIIRFLATACECKYIFLDHITMVVSGLNEDDERKTLDYISTRLAMMVEELDFSLVFVSHVNDEGRTRSSRNISKIADLWVHIDRNVEAESEVERNTSKLRVRKNRFAGHTGPADHLFFDKTTFRIGEPPLSLPPTDASL